MQIIAFGKPNSNDAKKKKKKREEKRDYWLPFFLLSLFGCCGFSLFFFLVSVSLLFNVIGDEARNPVKRKARKNVFIFSLMYITDFCPVCSFSNSLQLFFDRKVVVAFFFFFLRTSAFVSKVSTVNSHVCMSPIRKTGKRSFPFVLQLLFWFWCVPIVLFGKRICLWLAEKGAPHRGCGTLQ